MIYNRLLLRACRLIPSINICGILLADLIPELRDLLISGFVIKFLLKSDYLELKHCCYLVFHLDTSLNLYFDRQGKKSPYICSFTCLRGCHAVETRECLAETLWSFITIPECDIDHLILCLLQIKCRIMQSPISDIFSETVTCYQRKPFLKEEW